MTGKAMKAVDKGKDVIIKRPSSQRTVIKGGEFLENSNVKRAYSEGGNTIIGNRESMYSNDEPKVVDVVSSAVDEVKYDPNKNVCSVRFVGGGKFYDFQMTPDEFQEFMDSDSKGQWVNYVMKVYNRMPGY